MNKYDLNAQFDLYLKYTGLSKKPISEAQYTGTKRAFMGAIGQMLLLFRDDIGAIENEAEAVAVMENLFEQVETFWKETQNDKV
jgi:hypothetical protein